MWPVAADNKVSISVKGLSGESICEILVPAGLTVKELTVEIAADLGFPEAAVNLLFGSGQLESWDRLPERDLNVTAVFAAKGKALCEAAELNLHRYVRTVLCPAVSPEACREMLAFRCDNFTALHLATEGGCLEVAELLLNAAQELSELGRVILARDHLGDTPLHLAVEEGHIETVQLLLQSAADGGLRRELLLAVNGSHQSALHRAAARNRAAAAQALVLAAEEEGIREELLSLQDQEEAHEFVLQGSFTAVGIAARDGHAKIVEILLNASASHAS